MGFSWLPITQYVTEVAAAHINQVRTNVNSVYVSLELPAYGWAYLPVNVGDEIQHEDFKELRDAIDYADEQNYCRSYNASYCSADNPDYDSSIDTDDKGAYDNDVKAAVESTNRVGYYNNQNSGYNSSNLRDDHSPYHYAYEATNRVPNYSSVLNGENSSVQSNHDLKVYGAYDGSIYASN